MASKKNVQAQHQVSNPTTISIPKLQTTFDDQVIVPGDPGYDEARAVHGLLRRDRPKTGGYYRR